MQPKDPYISRPSESPSLSDCVPAPQRGTWCLSALRDLGVEHYAEMFNSMSVPEILAVLRYFDRPTRAWIIQNLPVAPYIKSKFEKSLTER
jgi:hypothetical protein